MQKFGRKADQLKKMGQFLCSLISLTNNTRSVGLPCLDCQRKLVTKNHRRCGQNSLICIFINNEYFFSPKKFKFRVSLKVSWAKAKLLKVFDMRKIVCMHNLFFVMQRKI